MTVRVPDGLHREFRRITGERGVSMNDELVTFIRRWVEHYGR